MHGFSQNAVADGRIEALFAAGRCKQNPKNQFEEATETAVTVCSTR